MSEIQIIFLPEFEKDLKLLAKKYVSIRDDLELILLILSSKPEPRPPFSFQLDQLSTQYAIIKIKKIFCKSLKGKGSQSGLRIIYAYSKQNSTITLVEFYHKGQQKRENRARILKYFYSSG